MENHRGTHGDIKAQKIVHELGPKQWVFGSEGWTKHNIDF